MNLTSILFENPYALIPILVATDLVLVQLWNRRRTPRTGRLAMIALIASPLLVVIQAVVVTDAENIRAFCRRLATASVRGDLVQLDACIANDFRVSVRNREWTKEDLMDAIRRAADYWTIEEERLSGFGLIIEGTSATAEFQATCRLISDAVMIPRHVSKWRLQLVRRDGTWRVTHIQPIRTRFFPFDNLTDVLR